MIGKYEWGVEYAANGKRPELADDVEVACFGYDGVNCGNGRVFERRWDLMEKFKITDQRYKPADTSYLNALTQAQSLTHKPIDEQQYEPVIVTGADIAGGVGGGGFMPKSEAYFRPKELESNWHESGEKPPVGTVCEYRYKYKQDSKWLSGKIMYIGTDLFVVSDGHEERAHFVENAKFRPIRTEREKVIEAAMDLTDRVVPTHRDICEALFDAGMLVLPPKKSDTKD